jgi:hypothetical protein
MSGFIGSGRIKIAAYESGATFGARKFRDVGNASVFTYSFTEDKKELRDYQDPAGGTADSVTRIDIVSGQIDFRDFSPENLALALWGTVATGGVTAITGEAHVINAGAFIPTARLINTAVAPLVKKGGTTVAASDYVVSKGGITIAATISTGGVADGDAITIDYTPIASKSVEAIINSAPNVSIFLEGVNAVTGKYASVRIYKAKLSVAQGVDAIGDDYGTLSVNYTITKDTTVTGAGISQFLKLEQET